MIATWCLHAFASMCLDHLFQANSHSFGPVPAKARGAQATVRSLCHGHGEVNFCPRSTLTNGTFGFSCRDIVLWPDVLAGHTMLHLWQLPLLLLRNTPPTYTHYTTALIQPHSNVPKVQKDKRGCCTTENTPRYLMGSLSAICLKRCKTQV